MVQASAEPLPRFFPRRDLFTTQVSQFLYRYLGYNVLPFSREKLREGGGTISHDAPSGSALQPCLLLNVTLTVLYKLLQLYVRTVLYAVSVQ